MHNGEELLMNTVGLFFGGLFVFWVVRYFFGKFLITFFSGEKFKPVDILHWAFQDAEVRRRILITVIVLAGVQAVSFLPLPGLDLRLLTDSLKKISQRSGWSLYLFYLSANLRQLRILSNGLTPFLFACILIQLASAFLPPLRRAAFWGEDGWKKIERLTWFLTLAIAIVMGSLMAFWLENPFAFSGTQIVSIPGWGFRFLTVLNVTAGTFLLLWAASLINNHGLGNGIALIVATGILLDLLSAFLTPLSIFFQNSFSSPTVFFLGIVLVVFLYVAFYATSREKRLNYATQAGETLFLYPCGLAGLGKSL